MAEGIGWKTAELQIETLVPGVLLIIGIDVALRRNLPGAVELPHIPLRGDTFVQAALFLAAAYAVGILAAIICRATIDGLSESGVRARVFRCVAHISTDRLKSDRLAKDKDRFEEDLSSEKNRRRSGETAIWNAAYRSAIRTTDRKAEVDRRRSQGRTIRNLALPGGVWTVALLSPTPVCLVLAILLGVLVFLSFAIPYAYSEYVNFAEAIDISAGSETKLEKDS